MLGSRLRDFRKSRGLSQSKLAEMINVGQSTVAMWESGRNKPEHHNLEAISNALQISVASLVGGSGSKSCFSIPELGYVRAGVPTEAVEEVLGHVDVVVPESDKEIYFALRIKGDSMSPRMMEGDTVIVKKQSDFESGDICVALVGSGDATVKKIIKKDSGIILMPLNSNYEPLFFTPQEIETTPVSIIGKVTELRAKI